MHGHLIKIYGFSADLQSIKRVCTKSMTGLLANLMCARPCEPYPPASVHFHGDSLARGLCRLSGGKGNARVTHKVEPETLLVASHSFVKHTHFTVTVLASFGSQSRSKIRLSEKRESSVYHICCRPDAPDFSAGRMAKADSLALWLTNTQILQACSISAERDLAIYSQTKDNAVH